MNSRSSTRTPSSVVGRVCAAVTGAARTSTVRKELVGWTLAEVTVAKHPVFSWSHTRDATLRVCARQYYWRYYAGHRGWSPDAAPLARRAYALRHLTTLPLVLGSAIHDCAAECARASCADRPLPSPATLRQRVREALNGVCFSRDRDQFLRSPRRSPMLVEMYYHGTISAESIARVKARMDLCLENLIASPVWEELRGTDPATVAIPEQPRPIELDGVLVYLAPDLCFHSGKTWVVADWKTGRVFDAWDQLSIYALYLEYVLRVPCSPPAYEGRVYYLSSGEEDRYRFTREDLDCARSRVAESVARMRELLRDPDENRPEGREAFLQTRNRSRCGTCAFLELCAPELGGLR